MNTSQFFACLLAILFVCATASAQHSAITDPASSNSAITDKLKLSPDQLSTNSTFRFTENRGQLADQFGKPMPEVKYFGESNGVQLYFTASGYHYVFSRLNKESGKTELERVDFAIIGARKNVQIESASQTNDLSNYYLAHCPNGVLGVRSFERVIYRELYPKIDMVLYTTDSGMKYDFVVKPGGDPRKIRVKVSNATELTASSQQLQVSSNIGVVTESAPYSYQQLGGKQQEVVCAFTLERDVFALNVGQYDRSRILVIDPPRSWGTYYGGTGQDRIESVSFDRQDNILVCGTTQSSTQISTAGSHQASIAAQSDGFIAKFNLLGQRIWATYFGGSSPDTLSTLAISPNGQIIVGGRTGSDGLSTAGSHQPVKDAGVSGLMASFNGSGVRQWATYYGGTPAAGSTGRDHIVRIAIDSNENIYAIGSTLSESGIATNGGVYPNFISTTRNEEFLSSFLAKFTSGGSRLWATYLYGQGTLDAIDGYLPMMSSDVQVSAEGDIYLSGSTFATSDIATPGSFKSDVVIEYTEVYGVLQKYSTAGSKIWGTYLFREHPSLYFFWQSNRVAVLQDLLYVTSWSKDIDDVPVATPGAHQTNTDFMDPTLSRFTLDGQRIWTTFYGGASDEAIFSLYASGATTDAYLAGFTTSQENFAGTEGEFQSVNPGSGGAFLARFDAEGVRKWGTFYSNGSGSNEGRGVTVGSKNQIVLAGPSSVTGTALSTPGAHKTVGQNPDGYVVLFCDTNIVELESDDLLEYCHGESATLTATSGFTAYQWQRNGTDISGATSRTYQTPPDLAPGVHRYTVRADLLAACVVKTDTIIVRVFANPKVKTIADKTICSGEEVTLATQVDAQKEPLTYLWSPALGLSDNKVQNPVAKPTGTTQYIVTVTDGNTCVGRDTVVITVNQLPVPIITGPAAICPGEKATLTVSNEFKTYFWSTGELTRTIQATKKGAYWVQSMDTNGCVGQSALFLLNVYDLPNVAIDGPNSACPNTTDNYTAQSQSGSTYTWTLVPLTGASITSGQGTSSIKINWQTAGSYQLKLAIKSDVGCDNDTTITIVVSDKLSPEIAITGSIPFCVGDSVTLSALAGYDTYLWTPGGEQTRSIVVKTAGDYSVAVTSAGGCSGTSTATKVIVHDGEIPKPEITASKSVICEGDSAVLSTKLSYSSYVWSTGETGSTITVKTAGSYSVVVSNAAGCKGTSESITLTVETKPVSQITAKSATDICAGDSVTLEATAGYSYDWMRDGTTLNITTPSLTVGQSGRYAVIVSNTAGCTAETNAIDVNVKPSPVIAIEGASSLCNNASASYSVKGAAGSTIDWQILPPSLGTITNGQGTTTVTIQWNAAANGILRVTADLNGCVAEYELPITLDDELVPTITPSGPLEFCEGSSVTLDAGSGYSSYRWTKDAIEVATSQTITVTTDGIYQVEVSSADGCQGTANVSVRVFPLPAKPVITQVGDDLVSTPGTTYWWTLDNVEIIDGTNQTQTALGIGAYRVTITDENGCENISDPFMIGSASAHVALPRWISGEAGKQIDVPLDLVNSRLLLESGASEYVARIRYNPALIEPRDFPGVSQGKWNIITATGLVQSASELLQTIRFTGLVDERLCDDISIDTFYFVSADVAVTTQGGYACVTNICAPGITGGQKLEGNKIWLGLPHPNPASSAVDVAFEIGESGNVRLELVNSLGARQKVLFDQYVLAGFYQRHVNLSEAAIGSYQLVLVKDRETRSTPLLIRR